MKACEMSAAFGLAQLKKLDKVRSIRKANINRYCERLKAAGTSYVLPERHNDYDWLAFPLMHKDRKGVLRFLEANEVQIRVCFAGNITRHPAYRHYLQDFPASDRIMARPRGGRERLGTGAGEEGLGRELRRRIRRAGDLP